MTKTTVTLLMLVLLFLKEVASTHLETCECHEIRSLVNASIEQAIARLEYKITFEINSAISRINKTDDTLALENGLIAKKDKLYAIESNLTSTMERLLKPIQQQLNYHLPLPSDSQSLGLWQTNSENEPAESCKAVFANDSNAPSGYYWIKVSSGSPIRVYCKMDATCGNLTGGWMRVAYMDMRNSSHQCPSGLTLTTRSSDPRRVCDVTSFSYTSCPNNTHCKKGLIYTVL